MLKLLFVLSVTALLFLVLLGLIRSKVEPQTTVRRRMESLETLAEEREPLHSRVLLSLKRRSRRAASSRCSPRSPRP